MARFSSTATRSDFIPKVSINAARVKGAEEACSANERSSPLMRSLMGRSLDTRLGRKQSSRQSLPDSGLVEPEIVEFGGRFLRSAEDPNAAGRVNTANGAGASARNVIGGSYVESSVDSGLVGGVGTAHPRPFAGAVFPDVIQAAAHGRGSEAITAEEPEVSAGINQADSAVASSRRIRNRGSSLRAVDTWLTCNALSCNPRPLPGTIFPHVVEITLRSAGIGALAAKEVEIAGGIRPPDGAVAAAGHVARGCFAEGSVNSRLIDEIRPAHPRPLAATIFPEIVEIAAAGGGCAESAEEPEVAGGIGPLHGPGSSGGNISGRSRAFGSVNCGFIGMR